VRLVFVYIILSSLLLVYWAQPRTETNEFTQELLLEADHEYLETAFLEARGNKFAQKPLLEGHPRNPPEAFSRVRSLQKALLEGDPGNPPEASSRGGSKKSSRSLFSRWIQEILQKPLLEGDPRNPPEASSRGGSRKSSRSFIARGIQEILQKPHLEGDPRNPPIASSRRGCSGISPIRSPCAAESSCISPM